MQSAALNQLQHLVNAGELRAALQELNRLAGCRFTAFFRFDDDGLRNLVFVDRDDHQAAQMETVPVEQSYCQYVLDSQAAFVVSDAMSDDRLADHVKRQVVRSYFGYPIKVDGAAVFGSLCHFDFNVVAVREDVLELTRAFAEGFDTTRAMDALQTVLDRRLQSLSLMTETILQSATTREEAFESFAMYAALLATEAERVLAPEPLDAFRTSIAGLEAGFNEQVVARI